MSAISIQPRKVDFDVSSVPRHWNGGDPVLTRFFDALSVHFPEGERFFIQSVRHFQDQVTDQRLREDIRHFIRQEGQHGIVHDRFNDVMEAQGIDVDQ
ncbi:metal-dependent hydrolase, partial [Alcanivorax sp. ZXX171]|nr:metal-dependent hydrolase [Alcanivorax sp. ZXX171]